MLNEEEQYKKFHNNITEYINKEAFLYQEKLS